MSLNVFVSFSGRDTGVIRRLLAALNRYPLTVWDYSREGYRIPFGEQISDYCKTRIEEAHYFLAFISSNTVSQDFGGYAQEETRHALQVSRSTRRDLVIVPVVDTSEPFPPLNAPYDELSGRLRLEFDGRCDESIEEATRAFCVETLHLDPVPTFRVDPRIRLIEHFRSEYRDFEHQYGDGHERMPPRGEYVRLDRLIEQFSETTSGSKPNWEEALSILQEISRTLRKYHLEEELYFILPMRGLCYYELGDFARAKSSFDSAILHKKADAHAFAGRALVEARLGQSEDALKDLLNAESCTGPAIPWEIRFNIACLLLASEQPVDLDDELLLVNPELLEPEDWVKFRTLHAVYLFKRGSVADAEAILRSVLERRVDGVSIADDNAVIWYAEVLGAEGHVELAADKLSFEATARNNPDLQYRAAYTYLEGNKLNKALQAFESLCTVTRFDNVKYMIGYIRLLKTVGNLERCLELCRRVIEVAQNRTNITFEDHYYLGLCHHILGNAQLSEYEFALGKSFAKTPYYQL